MPHHIFGLEGTAEDFPFIRQIYATINDTNTTELLALLDSEAFTGAISITLDPGPTTVLDVDSTFFPHRDVLVAEEPDTAFLAYSSMFWKDEGDTPHNGADEAHDLDQLVIGFDTNNDTTPETIVNAGMQLLRPAADLSVTQFDELYEGRPVFVALDNRDLDPTHYALYGAANYEQRSSYAFEILHSDIDVGLTLYEQPANDEYDDNIVVAATIAEDLHPVASAADGINFVTRNYAYVPTDSDGDGITDMLAGLLSGKQITQIDHVRQAQTLQVPSQYATIQAAIDTAQPGDRIEVAAGIFTENILVTKQDLRIVGTGPDQSIIQGIEGLDLPVVQFQGTDRSVVFNGFTVRGGHTGHTDDMEKDLIGGGIDILNAAPVIENTEITLNSSTAVGGGIAIRGPASDPLIQNNDIHHNETHRGTGNFAGLGGGIYLGDGRRAVIKNNHIHDNSGWLTSGGIHSGPLTAGGFTLMSAGGSVVIEGNLIENNTADNRGGIQIDRATGIATIRNNVIVNNQGSGGSGISVVNSDVQITNNTITENLNIGIRLDGTEPADVRNNIVTRNGVGILAPASAVLAYNDVWNNPQGNYAGGALVGAGSISDDPLHLDPTNRDYRLAQGSPAANIGDPGTQYNDTDGTRNDMGAYGGPQPFVGAGFLTDPEIDVQGNGRTIADGDSTPDAMDHTSFGEAQAGGAGRAQSFTITNTGSSTLSLTGAPHVSLSGAHAGDFAITQQPATTIAALGGATTFTVSFAPTATGIRTATIQIDNNDADEHPYEFVIEGVGLTNPAAPTITDPLTATTVDADTFNINGTAEANSLVRVYTDANDNGQVDGSDAVVASQQLVDGSSAFSISTNLTQNSANNFLVTASDAGSLESSPTNVPTITEGFPAPLSLTINDASISEASGPEATTVRVTRTGNTADSLTVAISNPDPSELFLPASVRIPAGKTFVDFAVATVNDGAIDGDQLALSIGASAGTDSASVLVDVTDDDTVNSKTLGGHLFEPILADTYDVLFDIDVDSGKTLIIAPGSTLEFASGVALNVNAGATLTADGDEGSEIVFTSGDPMPSPGDWKGISIASTTMMDFVEVAYAVTGMRISPYTSVGWHPQVTISNGNVHANSSTGIETTIGHSNTVGGPSILLGDVEILDSHIHSNAGDGIKIAAMSGLNYNSIASSRSNNTIVQGNEIDSNDGIGIVLAASTTHVLGLNSVSDTSSIGGIVAENFIHDNHYGIAGSAHPGQHIISYYPFEAVYNTVDLAVLETSLHHNIVTNNTIDGITLNTLGTQHRMRPQIFHNTIAGNGGAGLLHGWTSTGFAVGNNIIVGNQSGISGSVDYSPATDSVENNLLFDNNGTDFQNYPASFGNISTVNANGTPSDAESNIFVDPEFVALGDYHLLAHSPAIDAGIDLGQPFDGTAPDIGTFEYDPTGLVRTVRIRLTDADYLQLNEVEVLQRGTGTNLALYGTATQSSTYNSRTGPAQAIDGDATSGYPTSISLTRVELGAWWEVDLGGGFDVGTITVYNRSAAGTRLENAVVEALDADGSVVWSDQITSTSNGSIHSFEVATGPETTAPTADLANPTQAGTVSLTAINAQGYIDVTFADAGGSGLSATTIDGDELTLGGAGVGTAVLSGTPTLVDGTTFRYTFTGAFVVGPVDVNFVAGTWQDNAENANLAETESFTVQDFAPGVVAKVRVRLTDADYLQLNEVEVLQRGTGTNLALAGTATQSSTYNSSTGPEQAIDGDATSGYPTSISLTRVELGAWWQVDLGGGFDVGTITVYNRSDAGTRLEGCGRRSVGCHGTVLWSDTISGTSNGSIHSFEVATGLRPRHQRPIWPIQPNGGTSAWQQSRLRLHRCDLCRCRR